MRAHLHARAARAAVPGRSDRGFTLVEVILVIVLLGIIAAVGAQIMGAGLQSYVAARDSLGVDAQARLALERMTRELRAVRSPAGLTLAPSNEVTFVDADGATVRYCLAMVGGCPGTTAGDLMRNGQPLASGVSGLSFSYSDRNGAPTADPAQVFYISVQFNVAQGAMSGSYRATVNPRNFP